MILVITHDSVTQCLVSFLHEERWKPRLGIPNGRGDDALSITILIRRTTKGRNGIGTGVGIVCPYDFRIVSAAINGEHDSRYVISFSVTDGTSDTVHE